MKPLLREIRETPLLWMLIFVPAVLIAARIVPTAHTLLFVLAVLAIVPLAALLSQATEACSSSDNLRLIRHFEKGGSGSSGVRV